MFGRVSGGGLEFPEVEGVDWFCRGVGGGEGGYGVVGHAWAGHDVEEVGWAVERDDFAEVGVGELWGLVF